MYALERHPEVVGLRVERIAGVADVILAVLSHRGYEDVESAHARVAVAREVEVAVGAERREHLVARSVDGFAEVLHAAESRRRDACAPDVEAAHSARHVAREVEPLAVGRHCGVGIARQRVGSDLQFRGLAPCGVGSRRRDDLRVARICRVACALREIHRALVGRQRARSLVEVGVHAAGHRLGFRPVSLVVFRRHEDVGRLCARDAAQLASLRVVARGGEVELLPLVAGEHGRVVVAPRVEHVHAPHLVARALLLPPRRALG